MGSSRYELVFVGARIETERYQQTTQCDVSVRCDCDADVEVDAYCAKCGTQHIVKSIKEVTLKGIPPAIMDIAPDNIGDWPNSSFWYVMAHESGVIRDGVEAVGTLGDESKNFYLGVILCELDGHNRFDSVSIDKLKQHATAVKNLADDIGLVIVGEARLHVLTYWY